MTLDELEAKGDDDFDFEAAWKAVEPDDVLTLIYTSGTTGPPKGVQITHGNMRRPPSAPTTRSSSFPDGGRVVSYLPMAHIAERNVQPLPADGARLHGHLTARTRARWSPYLPEVRPTLVLRRAAHLGEAQGRPRGDARRPSEDEEQEEGDAEGARGRAEEACELEQAGEEVPEELAAAVRSRPTSRCSRSIREMLGLDQLEALQRRRRAHAARGDRVLPRASACRWPSCGACPRPAAPAPCNPPDKIKIGTVGPPAPGVEIKLAEDGEVLIRGRVVMPGYRNLPDKTTETIDRRRLAAHRRHRRVRRGRLPQDRRPQEGADHQRGRQEHVAGQHRGEASRPPGR